MTAALPSASVVIPTFNRLADLLRVVQAVGDQRDSASAGLEIVVVDDGSTDGTTAGLERCRPACGLRVIRQANAGPAAARNRGARAARGEVLLFLGDDTVPASGWLGTHLEEHRLDDGAASPLAVVGYTGFPPEVDGPFLRFVNEYGAQFGYELIDDPRAVPFNFFYTSNISLPRRFFLELEGFREDFSAAAWEDIEFAFRATRLGLRIHYAPAARTVHHHRVTPGTFCRRQRTSGRAAATFARLHPELEDFLGVNRLRAGRRPGAWQRPLLRAVVELGELIPGLVPPSVYQRYLDHAYLEGLAAGLHEVSP